jgi:uncharacterized protein YlaN (UPF0358 family)
MKPDRIPRKAKIYVTRHPITRQILNGQQFTMQDGRDYAVRNGSIQHANKPSLTKKQRNKLKKEHRNATS